MSALRLHQSLLKCGAQSVMLCRRTFTGVPEVHAFDRLKHLDQITYLLTSPLGLGDLHRLSSFLLLRDPRFRDADVVHLHGLHGGDWYVNYLVLPRLTRAKPTILTIRDMWCLTGHCAVNYDCDRWKTGCGRCPHLDAPPSTKRDTTRLQWRLKNRVYRRSDLTVVSLCSWYTERARQSMLSRFPIHQIPNGVDTDVFEPIDRTLCRRLLGLPLDKQIVLYAARDLSEHNKGPDLLRRALAGLPDDLKARTVLLLAGHRGHSIAQGCPVPCIDMGFISGDRFRAVACAAADLFVSPTRLEAFGQVILESLACGVPVVSFRVGGVPDLVRPGHTGYLAEPEDPDDLRDGIVQLLRDHDLRRTLGENARCMAQTEFSTDLEAERYWNLYRTVLETRQSSKGGRT